jgi:hypothetical protein
LVQDNPHLLLLQIRRISGTYNYGIYTIIISFPGGVDENILIRRQELHNEKIKNSALEKSSFQVMIAPLAPALPPQEAGAHCDAPVLPEPEISPGLRTGNTTQSPSADAIAAGVCLHAKKSLIIIQRISPEANS